MLPFDSQCLRCPECKRYQFNECSDMTALECLTSDDDTNFIPAENNERVDK